MQRTFRGGGMPRTWVAAITACVALAAFVPPARAGGGDDDAKARAVALLRSALPRAGAVEAVYTATEGFGEVLIGFDVPSGAWYYVTGAVVQGRDTAGKGFGGPPGYPLNPEDQSVPGADEPLDTLLPTTLARDLVARPETIREVRPLPDGGFRIVAAYPGGLRDGRVPSPDRATPRAWWIDVDASGVISALAYNNEKELDGDARKFRYRAAGPPGFQLVETPPDYPFRLSSYTYSEKGDPGAFTMDTVASLAAQSVLTVAGRVSAAGQALFEGGAADAPGRGPDSAGDGYNPLARYRLPLLGAGIVVVVIGVLAMWRTRRKA